MIVMVMWEDAAYHLDYQPEIHDAVTVGFVLEDNLNHIKVAGERLMEQGGEEYIYRGVTTIPKRSVVKISELKYPIIGD